MVGGTKVVVRAHVVQEGRNFHTPVSRCVAEIGFVDLSQVISICERSGAVYLPSSV